jgi:ATP-dependent DNA helicase RecG
MDSIEINELVALGEGFTLEFKRSVSDNLGREICAFANTTGGKILIGVEDNGHIVGIKNVNKLKSRIQNIVRSIDPPLSVDIIVFEDTVLVVDVPEQRGKPFSYAGKFYIREGATSQQLNRSEIREFFFKEGAIKFDEMKNDWFDLKKDIHDDNYSTFCRRANLPIDMDKSQVLENLHLIKNGYMTNAGAWLLARDILKFNSSGNLSCALFMGTTKTRIIDRKDFNEDVYSNYQNAVNYLLNKLNTEFIIKALGREERLELPEEALREAVVNAVAHRDYRSTANVQIYIFQDRVEIVSPGGLPAGMTRELLGQKSIPRNPLLFGILYRMNAVEHVGSGIKRIRQACKDYQVNEPVFEIDDYWFTLTFARTIATPQDTGQVTPQDTPQDTPQVKKLLKELVGEMDRNELQKALGLKDRFHFREAYLIPALEAELIEMTIPDKPTSKNQKYRLTRKGREHLKQKKGEPHDR